MKSFLVVIFLLVPYLMLSVQANTDMSMQQHAGEMMLCCADDTDHSDMMDCCSTHESNEHDCGSSACDEMSCNTSIQLQNLFNGNAFSFAKPMLTDQLKFSLESRNIVSVNLESIWNPPKINS